MTHAAPQPAPEFSRIIDVETLLDDTTEIDLEPTDQERLALAQRFSLDALDSLKAHLILQKPQSGGPLRLDARITAQLTQTCVVTLEPVHHGIDTEFFCTFSAESDPENETELEIDPDAADPPEPLVDGQFDAGELVAEYLGLEIDPFPRAQNADFQEVSQSYNINKPDETNPFAVLRERGAEKK